MASLFDENRPDQRALGMALITSLVVVAYGASNPFGTTGQAFAAGLCAWKDLLSLSYWRERHWPAAKTLASWYAMLYTVQSMIWATAGLFQGTLAWSLWGAALVLDLVSPFFVARYTTEYPLHSEHLPESSKSPPMIEPV